MSDLDQIAAESWEKICRLNYVDPYKNIAIIKAAIEKANKVLLDGFSAAQDVIIEQGKELQRLRAAQASEK